MMPHLRHNLIHLAHSRPDLRPWLLPIITATEKKRMKIYHGSANAAEIVASGFDFSKIKPRWLNDYAISTITSPKAIERYFGRAIPIVEMVFSGELATSIEVSNMLHGQVLPRSSKDYTKLILSMGIDAVIFGESGARIIYVYNPRSINNLNLYTPK